MAQLWLNIGCGPHRAPVPWWNVDVVERDGVAPDEVVELGRLPYGDGSCERLYLGHVLEHIDWVALPAYMAELRRVLRPAAEVLAVGPDVERTINRWHQGLEPWSLVTTAMEGASSDLGWEGARHRWNCTESRLVGLFEQARFADVAAVAVDAVTLTGWPVVSYAPWQCAVRARA